MDLLTEEERKEIIRLKFRASKFKGKDEHVPSVVKDVFNWVQSMDSGELDALVELRNLYKLLKKQGFKRIIGRLEAGEEWSKKDIELIKLIKETIVDYSKIKYGEKKTVTHEININDIRKAIFAKPVVEVDGTVSQDLVGSGCGEGTGQKDGKDN